MAFRSTMEQMETKLNRLTDNGCYQCFKNLNNPSTRDNTSISDVSNKTTGESTNNNKDVPHDMSGYLQLFDNNKK